MGAQVDISTWCRDGGGAEGPRHFVELGPRINAISWMTWPERMLIYSSVYALRPQRCLEIGTFQGGSASLIVGALDDVGSGQVVCVDPNPRVTAENWAKIAHRAKLVSGPSPEVLKDAEKVAGGKFDWALIDGDHSYDGLVRDLEGTLPTLADEAFLLFHDAYYHEVDHGLKDMYAKHRQLTDLGMISRASSVVEGVKWGGIRMARFNR